VRGLPQEKRHTLPRAGPDLVANERFDEALRRVRGLPQEKRNTLPRAGPAGNL